MSARTPIFAANWKMNSAPSEARTFMRTFLTRYARRPDRTVIFFPPALSFAAVKDALKERSDIAVGVQNIHWEAKGAFTGENSAPIARDAGATHVQGTANGYGERAGNANLFSVVAGLQLQDSDRRNLLWPSELVGDEHREI